MTEPTQKRISDHDEYLRPEYLPASGAAFTIHAWHEEKTRRPDGTTAILPVLVFTSGKRLLINVTNLRRLVTLFANDEAASIGKSIVLRPGQNNGKATIIIDRVITRTKETNETT